MSSSSRPWWFAAVLALAAGCSGEPRSPGARVELAVYAAASSREALLELEPIYEERHAVDLLFNFGSSGDLAKQIVAAVRADVFLSADEKEMDFVARAQLVADGSRRDLLANQLVVIEPSDGGSRFSEPFTPAQLAQVEIRLLSLADVAAVPAGRYAKDWLERAGVWSSVAARVLPGIDVRAALAAVESGGAQAGIVYRTDAAVSPRVRIVHEVPLEQGPRITYPAAVVATRPHELEARAFVEFLASPTAGAVFDAHGFVFLPTLSSGSR